MDFRYWQDIGSDHRPFHFANLLWILVCYHWLARNVLLADATDSDFWGRVKVNENIDLVVQVFSEQRPDLTHVWRKPLAEADL